MKTFFTKKLRQAISAAATTLTMATLVSCGGDDDHYDVTISYFPEYSLAGFALDGSIEIDGYDDSYTFYLNRIVSIYFYSDSYARIVYDDGSSYESDYEYTPAYDGVSAFITIRVPADLTSYVGADEYYALTIENPSSNFRVALGDYSFYQTETANFYFYAEEGSLEFYYAE